MDPGSDFNSNCSTLCVLWKCHGQAVKSIEFKLWCFWSAECGFESPAVTLVSLSKPLNHCFVLRIRRKAIGPMCCANAWKNQVHLSKREGVRLGYFIIIAFSHFVFPLAPAPPVNPCDSSPCQNGGICFRSGSREVYVCSCSDGFSGIHCENGKKYLNSLSINRGRISFPLFTL